jgi:hypothetical protein
LAGHADGAGFAGSVRTGSIFKGVGLGTSCFGGSFLIIGPFTTSAFTGCVLIEPGCAGPGFGAASALPPLVLVVFVFTFLCRFDHTSITQSHNLSPDLVPEIQTIGAL